MTRRIAGIAVRCPKCGHEWIYSGTATATAWITCSRCHRKSALLESARYSSIEEELEGRIQDLIAGLGIRATVARRKREGGEEILITVSETS